jgi:hypothetical protein
MARTKLETPLKKVRKPKTVRTIQAEYIRNKIAERLSEEALAVINAQIEAAKGTAVLTTEGPSGVTTSYGKPDVNAAKSLFEQVLGRPKETVEHKGNVGLLSLITKLENDEDD